MSISKNMKKVRTREQYMICFRDVKLPRQEVEWKGIEKVVQITKLITKNLEVVISRGLERAGDDPPGIYQVIVFKCRIGNRIHESFKTPTCCSKCLIV